MQSVRITVVICAHNMNRLNDTYEAIQSVLDQKVKPHELIISVDHNEELYNKFKDDYGGQIKVVINRGARGLSDTRNIGIRSAVGDIVAFIDDDAIAAPNWLECLSQPFSDSSVVAVGGKSVPLWVNGKKPLWFPEEFYWALGCTYRGMPVSWNKETRNVLGCNMAFRKSVFEKVGYFKCDIGGIDNTPRGGEEADLCLRMKQSSSDCIILYEENALIFHKVPLSRLQLKYILRRTYNDGYYKRLVEKSFPSKGEKTLSTENQFFRYIIVKAIPERLKGFYRKECIAQGVIITLCTIMTGAGYLKAVMSSKSLNT